MTTKRWIRCSWLPGLVALSLCAVGPETLAAQVTSRAYMQPGAANPGMRLEINGTYPDTEPITALSPELLAAFPPLPVEVAYRVVGRTPILVDVKSRLIVDIARMILPPAA